MTRPSKCHQDGRDQQRGPEADERGDGVRDVTPQGQEAAVGEVDHAAQVEDEGQTQGHEHVEGPDDESVGHVEEDEVRHGPASEAASGSVSSASRAHASQQNGTASLTVPSCLTVRANGAAHSVRDQLQLMVQPVSATGPAAFSPGILACTVNMLSGSPLASCASPANTVLMSS